MTTEEMLHQIECTDGRAHINLHKHGDEWHIHPFNHDLDEGHSPPDGDYHDAQQMYWDSLPSC